MFASQPVKCCPNIECCNEPCSRKPFDAHVDFWCITSCSVHVRNLHRYKPLDLQVDLGVLCHAFLSSNGEDLIDDEEDEEDYEEELGDEDSEEDDEDDEDYEEEDEEEEQGQ
eukprot:scaffold41990_cov20-Tisochrysis_lutea.AAC.1